MNISVIGTGYVGLSTGVCLAEIGHRVTCIDIDPKKVEMLKKGISPIYEPGIEEYLQKNIMANRLSFTNLYQDALIDTELIFLTVGTPQGQDGKPDLSYIEAAARGIAFSIKKDTVIVIKSTVPVGTNDRIKQIIIENCSVDINVDIVSNPEFLREGSAIMDTLKADRIILGSSSPNAIKKVKKLYETLNVPILETDLKSAEMIKYASNAFLAMKISYINEIANLCEFIGADVLDVAEGMGMDKRIGKAFLHAGIGYGGSCFPKDILALHHIAEEKGMTFNLLQETIKTNTSQQFLLLHKAQHRLGELKDKKIAVLGLAFKPGTDDIREAPSIKIIRALLKKGASVSTFDPVATENMKDEIDEPTIEFSSSIYDAVSAADAVFIVTEWDEIKYMDLGLVLNHMKQPIIFDGRNCIKEEQIMKCKEIEYYPVGRSSVIKKASNRF